MTMNTNTTGYSYNPQTGEVGVFYANGRRGTEPSPFYFFSWVCHGTTQVSQEAVDEHLNQIVAALDEHASGPHAPMVLEIGAPLGVVLRLRDKETQWEINPVGSDELRINGFTVLGHQYPGVELRIHRFFAASKAFSVFKISDQNTGKVLYESNPPAPFSTPNHQTYPQKPQAKSPH